MFIFFHRIIVTVANRMEKDTETVRLAKVEALLSCFYYVQRTSYYDMKVVSKNRAKAPQAQEHENCFCRTSKYVGLVKGL